MIKITVLIENKVAPSRYAKVLDQMKTLGTPVIKCVVLTNGMIYALEGSHRVTAAKELGLVPFFDIIATVDSEADDWKLCQYEIDGGARFAKGLYVEFNHGVVFDD
jgi:hypothetical protein